MQAFYRTALSRAAGAARATAIAITLGAATLALAPVAAHAQNAPASFADLAERLSPAVVNISTAQTVDGRPNGRRPDVPRGLEELFRDFYGQGPDTPRRSVRSLGSGFIVDPDGFVVTNNHVIRGADQIEVIFADGRKFEAKLVGADPTTDLALLKIEADAPLPFVSFGDSDVVRVGDWVMAIGNPFGLGGTVTAGIISAKGRNIGAGRYDNFLQTDASINRGNSGGPLFNMDGDVIGVNTAIYSQTGGSVGIGFAVPATLAASVIKQLRENGEVRRGWLGVSIQSVDATLAESIDLGKPRGALVALVIEGGPAEKAGLERGDVILSFNGREVEDSRSLQRIVAAAEVGSDVPVVVFRKGQEVELTVKVALLEEDELRRDGRRRNGDGAPRDDDEPRRREDGSALGMRFEEITPRMRREFGLERGAEGVVITNIERGSSAREKGLRVGDVIVEVSQREVATVADVERVIRAAEDARRRAVLLTINRNGSYLYIAVDLEN